MVSSFNAKFCVSKAKWKIHKNSTCCFEQILKVASYKLTAVWLLISHLINYPNKTAGHVGPEHSGVDRPVETYIHQLLADLNAV